MQLSPHFSLDELTATTHADLLEANKADAQEFIGNLTDLCEFVLEPLRALVRALVGKPISINSGFRGKTLNAKVGGVSTSQHSFGEASDVHVDGMPIATLFNLIKANIGIFNGKVGQVIHEKVGGAEWVHISYMSERYKPILQARYGKAQTVFLTTTDGKTYTRVG